MAIRTFYTARMKGGFPINNRVPILFNFLKEMATFLCFLLLCLVYIRFPKYLSIDLYHFPKIKHFTVQNGILLSAQ